MEVMTASEAKIHFGALVDKAQKKPVTIERQGRPVAVVMSFEDYHEHHSESLSQEEKEAAVTFLKNWSKRPALAEEPSGLGEDVRAKAIWDKYTAKG